MPSICKLNITVKSISLHSNGLIPLPLPQSEIKRLSNAITATVLYPNSDAQGAVVGMVAPILINENNTDITFNFEMNNLDGVHPPDPQHPAARLFRYLILDNTDGAGSSLFIDVTETMKASTLDIILLQALGGALNAGVSLVPGGALVTGVVQGLASGVGTWLTKLGGDDLRVIGSTSGLKLDANQLLASGKSDYTLDLISGPKAIERNWFIPGKRDAEGNPVAAGETVLVPANTKNGSITLTLQAFPMS